MRWIIGLLLLVTADSYGQLPWSDYKINANGDTLNRVDLKGRKQGPWLERHEQVRGEPGFEEEGWYSHNRKKGEWKLFSLMGDLMGIEYYKWGMKDSVCRYFNIHGTLRAEQSWLALNPDKVYDTLVIEDLDLLDTYRTVIVKNEGASVKHGLWKYYDGETGSLLRTERYTLGTLEKPDKTAAAPMEKKKMTKPKEIEEFEKKNAGKKKVKYRDGSTGN